MKVKSLMVLFLSLMMSSLWAQVSTTYVDLNSDSFVPLYDCNIYNNNRNQNLCRDLKKNRNVNFEYGGYAVNCSGLRNKVPQCQRLASELSHNAQSLIYCGDIGNRINQERCEVTKEAYSSGSFNDYSNNEGRADVSYDSSRYTRRGTVLTTQTTCNMNAYDVAIANWQTEKAEQERKGRRRAIIGVGVMIGGVILGASNDGTVRAVGEGMQIGGAVLTAWGLVEMDNAQSYYPHLNPYCQTNWVSETRRTVIERQECTTTRYSERDYYSSRYYYEVNCSTKRYVTFEEFSPWHDGYVTTSYSRY